MEHYLVETEFLIGLIPTDKWHTHVMKVLELYKQSEIQLSVLVSAFLETRAIFYSHEKTSLEVSEALLLLKNTCEQWGLKEIPLLAADILLADKLRASEPDLTYFDSLHAAVSQRCGFKILSNDSVYEKIGVLGKRLANF
jgi:predicted nucleic acid-binding protein